MQLTNDPRTKLVNIELQPIGKRIQIEKEKTLLEAAQESGVDLTSICGGAGICESCRIRIVEGRVSDPTLEELETFTQEEISAGYRLACQASPLADVVIDIPAESLTSSQRLQVESQNKNFSLDPLVRSNRVHLPPPSLNDLRSDLSRLKANIDLIDPLETIEYPVLNSLSDELRASDWWVDLVSVDRRLVSILPASPKSNEPLLLGLAVDVGTTKLAAYLVDLRTGETVTSAGAMNPQIAFGEDVISRISYVLQRPEGNSQSARKTLQQKIVASLNQMVAEMLESIQEKPVNRNHLVDAVIVGNTAMHHFLAGLPVRQLGLAPYVPAVSEALSIACHDIGLALAPGARVYLPPNIAGYVGADHTAMLLATLYDPVNHWGDTDKTILAIDIGTNTEISLLKNRELFTCSCASGPAFEGAHIQFGMRAAPGAIERMQITKEKIYYKTINDQPAAGICGSGILDAISAMYQAGVLDYRGLMNLKQPGVRKNGNQSEFILAPSTETAQHQDIVITRRDVNEIQLAKGAIRAGIEILMSSAQVEPASLDLFIVAGAFGTYLDLSNAMTIGMFPRLPLEKFKQVGNAAGAGAKQLLLSRQYRQLAGQLGQRIHYIELANHPQFNSEFSKALFFAAI